MTEPFELRRRTPAGRLRYLAEQVARTNGLDSDDRTRLAAVRLGLEMLADELDAQTVPATRVLCLYSLLPVLSGSSECGKPSCRCHQEAAQARVLFCGEACREAHTAGPECIFTPEPSEEQLRRWLGDRAGRSADAEPSGPSS